MEKRTTEKLVLTALFICLAMLLPTFFHMLKLAGQIFSPMHIPVFLCGMICGKRYGLLCGLISPFLSSFLTGMPPVFPVAIAMSFELMTYGYVSGYLRENKNYNVIISLIIAMIAGRLVLGITNTILYTFTAEAYSLSLFITSAFVKVIPGIILQIILIPAVVTALDKLNVTNRYIDVTN